MNPLVPNLKHRHGIRAWLFPDLAAAAAATTLTITLSPQLVYRRRVTHLQPKTTRYKPAAVVADPSATTAAIQTTTCRRSSSSVATATTQNNKSQNPSSLHPPILKTLDCLFSP
jgi:hypothetical protein